MDQRGLSRSVRGRNKIQSRANLVFLSAKEPSDILDCEVERSFCLNNHLAFLLKCFPFDYRLLREIAQLPSRGRRKLVDAIRYGASRGFLEDTESLRS